MSHMSGMHASMHALKQSCTHARMHRRYEVMPGEWSEVMPNLETLIKTSKVQGA